MKNSMKKREVQQVHRKRPELVTRFFVFKTGANEVSNNRLCFAFSRKVGNAVIRNRYKRRLRELLRVTPLGGRDFMCIAKKSLSQISKAQWESEKQKIGKWFEAVQSSHHSTS